LQERLRICLKLTKKLQLLGDFAPYRGFPPDPLNLVFPSLVRITNTTLCKTWKWRTRDNQITNSWKMQYLD